MRHPRRLLRPRVRAARLRELGDRADRRHRHDPAAPGGAGQHHRPEHGGHLRRLDSPDLHRRLGLGDLRRREPAVLGAGQPMGETMEAVLVRETGGPDVLEIEEVERPEPADGEVLIRVEAASVNPADWKYRRGTNEKALPAVLGFDLSGTVEQSRSEAFSQGDEVFGIAASGSYA